MLKIISPTEIYHLPKSKIICFNNIKEKCFFLQIDKKLHHLFACHLYTLAFKIELYRDYAFDDRYLTSSLFGPTVSTSTIFVDKIRITLF